MRRRQVRAMTQVLVSLNLYDKWVEVGAALIEAARDKGADPANDDHDTKAGNILDFPITSPKREGQPTVDYSGC
jgi:hypothetical protein